jgi:hypothetical protein
MMESLAGGDAAAEQASNDEVWETGGLGGWGGRSFERREGNTRFLRFMCIDRAAAPALAIYSHVVLSPLCV